LNGEAYLAWFSNLAEVFSNLLTKNGSIVVELGNAWEKARPIQSLLHLQSLLTFVSNPKADLRLCQQFVCYNPSRLPSPAQWVTINRIRLTDSYTHIWWMAKTDYPKADNRRVLREYSNSMKSLLHRGTFNKGKRPSQHSISETGFLTDHGGSISHNFFELENMSQDREVRLPNAFNFANTSSNDYYHRKCRELKLTPHPARMPEGLANFFVQFLTEPGDLVLDPFGGTNTTGFMAEQFNRKWMSFEIHKEYAQHSRIRLESLKNRRIKVGGSNVT
jgi:tRNA G10  N-methylase Trm11